MDIKEVLVQIKQVPAVLEAFKAVDELLTLVVTCQQSIDELTKTKEGLESDVSTKNSELSTLQEKYNDLSNKLAENYEKARNASTEAMRGLKATVNKEYDEAKTSSDAKIDEFKGVVRDFQGKANDLAAEIIEKKEFLKGLNQSIESIKVRLTT